MQGQSPQGNMGGKSGLPRGHPENYPRSSSSLSLAHSRLAISASTGFDPGADNDSSISSACILLITHVEDFQAEDIVARYKAPADIERGFRVLKQDIEIAPVFHYKPDRIRAHALICFLALVIHRVMRRRLRQHNGAYSVERALDKLQAIQIHQVRIGYRTYRGLTQMTPEQLDLFKILEVEKPGIGAL